MREELESLWYAMKDSHFRRCMEELDERLDHSTNLDAALHEAVKTVLKAMHGEAGTLWFYERYQDGRIYPKVSFPEVDFGGVSLLPGEGIAGQVIQSGEALIIPDCQADERWAGRVDARTGFVTKSMICVPLVTDGNIFGCLQLINKTDGTAFDEKDLKFSLRLAEEVLETMQQRGVLELYSQPEETQEREPGFMELLCRMDRREQERWLRGRTEFAKLRLSQQQEVLHMVAELSKFFK